MPGGRWALQHGSHQCNCPVGRWFLRCSLDPSQREPSTAAVRPEDIFSLPEVSRGSSAEPANSRCPKQWRKAVTNEGGTGGISISKVCLRESQRRRLLWRWRRLKTEMFTCLQGAGPELRHHQGLDCSRSVGGDISTRLHTLPASPILGIAKCCLEGIADSSSLCS